MQRDPGNKIWCRPKFKKNRPGITAFAVMVLISATGGFSSPCLYAETPPTVQAPSQAEIPRAVTVSLYFAGQDRLALLAEQRQLPRPKSPVAHGRTIIRELTAGPRNENLMRTLPDSDILRSFFIAPDKTAYVDLGNEMWTRHPGGVRSDILALYSIVNSLVLNMAEVDAVKILVLGREPIIPAGHLDLRYPLKADILLIR